MALTICDSISEAFLAAAALQRGSGGGAGARRRQFRSQSFRITVLGREARIAPGDARDDCQNNRVPVAFVNQVGGNDSLVFDGSSLVFDREGKVIARGKSFEEDLIFFDSDSLTGEVHEQIVKRPVFTRRLYWALATTSLNAASARPLWGSVAESILL